MGEKALGIIREGVKLPKGIQNRIPELVHSVACDKDVVALYAFGGLAHNSLKPLSDLDFGFLLSIRMDKHQRFDKHIELIGLFTNTLKTEEIDLINMRDVPKRIAFQILKTGELLFCSDRRSLTDYREQVVKSTSIDKETVYGFLQNNLEDFKFFQQNVVAYLNQNKLPEPS